MKRYLLLFIAFFMLFGQSSSPINFFDDVSKAADMTWINLGRPLHWSGEDWTIMSYVLGSTVLLSSLDRSVDNFFQRNQTEFNNDVRDFGHQLGEPRNALYLTAGTYALAHVFQSEKLRDVSIILFSTLFPASMHQSFLKKAVGRSRPHLKNGPFKFKPFADNRAYYSFLSGHTIAAVSSSLVFAKQFESPIIKSVFYTLGGIGAVSRVYGQQHWMSDVVLGTAYAYFMVEATYALYYNDDNQNDETTARLKLRPHISGISLSYDF